MSIFNKLIPPFLTKKRAVINGSDKIVLLPEKTFSIQNITEYNDIQDISTFVQNQIGPIPTPYTPDVITLYRSSIPIGQIGLGTNIIDFVLIPANTAQETALRIIARSEHLGTPNTSNQEIYINTVSNTILGGTSISGASQNSDSQQFDHLFVCTSNSLEGKGLNAPNDQTTFATFPSTTVDWTVDQYLLFVLSTTAGSTINSKYREVTQLLNV